MAVARIGGDVPQCAPEARLPRALASGQSAEVSLPAIWGESLSGSGWCEANVLTGATTGIIPGFFSGAIADDRLSAQDKAAWGWARSHAVLNSYGTYTY
jgi:hypothetical protein